MHKSKKKVLHSSFACDPNTGSEAYVGWNWAKMLSNDFDLHVITRKHHYDAIKNTDLSRKVSFHFFDLPGCETIGHWDKYIKPYYVVWQFFVLFKVFCLHSRNRYVLIHHITYNNIDVPGFLWLLPRVKFAWGPIGGGQIPPESLKWVYGQHWKKQIFRKWLKLFAKFNPVVRLAIDKASLVLFANKDTENLLNGIKIKKIKRMLETAINSPKKSIIKAKKMESTTNIFKLLWVGRIEHRKALMLALDAISYGNKKYGNDFNVSLDILGEGPLMESMKEYTSTIQIDSFVSFYGHVMFNQVEKYFGTSDAFLFTSVQDTSGNVMLEAMSAGLPVIALNHQGAREILKYDGGILIDIDKYSTTVKSFADAIFSLKMNPHTYQKKSASALDTISANFTWKTKREEIVCLYKEILYSIT